MRAMPRTWPSMRARRAISCALSGAYPGAGCVVVSLIVRDDSIPPYGICEPSAVDRPQGAGPDVRALPGGGVGGARGRRRRRAVSAATIRRIALPIDGMSCAACAARIERPLNRRDGVQASVDYAPERAAAEYD